MQEFNIKITNEGIYINNKLHNNDYIMDKVSKEDDLNKKAILALVNEMGYEATYLFEEITDTLDAMVNEQ